jgi:hypothetical protein
MPESRQETSWKGGLLRGGWRARRPRGNEEGRAVARGVHGVEDKGRRGKRKLEADLGHESIRSQLLIRGRGYPESSYIISSGDRKAAVVHPSDREPGVSWCC